MPWSLYAANMPRPAPPPGPIITLAYRVSAARRAALVAFLGEAFEVYERPPGVRMALYESADDPELVVELVIYESRAAYDADQVRVDSDPEMVATLTRFREVVGGPVEIRRLVPVDVART
jgi:hypothetical protein